MGSSTVQLTSMVVLDIVENIDIEANHGSMKRIKDMGLQLENMK